MAARCASCSYPLTISDSVTCYECTSYFHIDCAQLVGFPYYELSSDPNRNTFHCATCKLLPLPRRQSFSDSDSDCGCAMPSRQLDYHTEGQPDFSVDMNEIKGSVQDLSDLCKDMLREINDLKSINLTLRCCVENLRHENEARDQIVEELKRRLDALETSRQRNAVEPFDLDMERLRPEEDLERYMTPEPPACSKEDEEAEISFTQNIKFDHSVHYFKTEDAKTEDNLSESILLEEKKETEYKEMKEKFLDFNEDKTYENDPNTECCEGIESESAKSNILNNDSQETEKVSTRKPSIETKPEDVKETAENRQDWTWKGNEAITLDNEEEETEITDEGAVEEESEVDEDVDAQEWELLNEEIQTETTARQFGENVTTSAVGEDWNTSDKEEEELDTMEEENEGSWAEKHERPKRHAEEEEWRLQGDDYEENQADKETGNYLENDDEAEENTEIKAEHFYKEDRPEIDPEKEVETIAEEGKEDEETPLAGEDGEEVPEHTEGEILSEGVVLTEGDSHPEGEVPLEGEPQTEEELHLEGETPKDEEGQPVVEGEQFAGGQSPEEGEVQPAEPPPPPEPQHTEEDLWHYLKEAVTSVHPATVEEFVQNLIGTLQQVPDEYLKPVIDANIKRATSPSVTDGEHLPAESHLEGEEAVPVEDSPPLDNQPLEDGEFTLSADDHSAPILDDIPSAEEESAEPTGELTSEIPEDHVVDEDPNDGYPALEAAA